MSHPIYEPESDPHYSLEVIARVTGTSTETIVRYQESGLLPAGDEAFDDEAIHTLRRIEHLRRTCEVNTEGLRLILSLSRQIDELKAALRTSHR